MKFSRKQIIVTTILTLAPIIIGLLLWNQLPDEIGTHFNINNQPDSWMSKSIAVVGLPVGIAAIEWFCLLATRYSKKSNLPPALEGQILWLFPAISFLTACLTYGYALNRIHNIGQIVLVFLGILFMWLGNSLPKAEYGYTYGFRVPWIMNRPKLWKKVQRFSGYCMVFGGLLVALFGLLNWTLPAALILAASVLAPFIYSLLVLKSSPQ